MKMVNNALSFGSVAGIPIRLHISLLIAVPLFAIWFQLGFVQTLIIAVGIFGSVALHELGHALVARAKGGYIHEIVLYPFGGAAKISNIPVRPIDEMMVAMAGPAVSFLLMLLFYQIEFLRGLGYLNGMLFFFNILPVFPMDGGRVFRAALTIKKGRLKATRVAATVGKYFCGLFVWVGLFGLKIQLLGFIGPFDRNYVLAFIGFYIWKAGQQEYRMVILENGPDQFARQQEAQTDFEVSPPPYAANSNNHKSLAEKLRKLFRN